MQVSQSTRSIIQTWGVGTVDLNIYISHRPFYSCALSSLAFEWVWGWGWPCFRTNLLCFLMEIMLKNTRLYKNNMIYTGKQEGFVASKQGQLLLTVKWPTCIFQFNHQKQGLYASVPVPSLLKMASKANSCLSLANGPRSMILTSSTVRNPANRGKTGSLKSLKSPANAPHSRVWGCEAFHLGPFHFISTPLPPHPPP